MMLPQIWYLRVRVVYSCPRSVFYGALWAKHEWECWLFLELRIQQVLNTQSWFWKSSATSDPEPYPPDAYLCGVALPCSSRETVCNTIYSLINNHNIPILLENFVDCGVDKCIGMRKKPCISPGTVSHMGHDAHDFELETDAKHMTLSEEDTYKGRLDMCHMLETATSRRWDECAPRRNRIERI